MQACSDFMGTTQTQLTFVSTTTGLAEKAFHLLNWSNIPVGVCTCVGLDASDSLNFKGFRNSSVSFISFSFLRLNFLIPYKSKENRSTQHQKSKMTHDTQMKVINCKFSVANFLNQMVNAYKKKSSHLLKAIIVLYIGSILISSINDPLDNAKDNF